jgi:hypothetical protein
MNIFKLQYPTKELALQDLKSKGVLIETEEGTVYGQGVHAVVEIGLICINEPTEEIEAIYAEGYHYDVMVEQEIDFGVTAIEVTNPKHNFAGYEKQIEIIEEEL